MSADRGQVQKDLSILFVRFPSCFMTKTRSVKLAFNSLCEIHWGLEDLAPLISGFLHFQFSLWDSPYSPWSQTGGYVIAFNSLCEILNMLFKGSVNVLMPFNSLCEIPELPCRPFQLLPLYFQFSLWDSVVYVGGYWYVFYLSILFVRFKSLTIFFTCQNSDSFQFSLWDSLLEGKPQRKLESYLNSFNSLCEIRRIENDESATMGSFDFQFSLWDSVEMIREKLKTVLIAFNSLCEILQFMKRNMVSRLSNFQFSLWDSSSG